MSKLPDEESLLSENNPMEEAKEHFIHSSAPSASPTAKGLFWFIFKPSGSFLNIIQWSAILLLAFLYLYERASRLQHSWETGQIYSPAIGALKRKDIVFTTGFGDGRTIYMGAPSPKVDAAWQDLYNYGVSRLIKEEAQKMVNKTLPIPNDPGYYITELSVFHQLHCLNQIRRSLYLPTSPSSPTPPSPDPLLALPHLEHCIDLLRQSLMCAGDIALLSWRWDEADQMSKPIAAVPHTCRDWSLIEEWAKKNHAWTFDTSVHVPDW